MKQLKKRFSNAAKPQCTCGTKDWLPSNDYEAHTGLTGLSGHYIFPRGLSATAYQDYVSYASQVFSCYSINRQDYTLTKISEPDRALLQKMRDDWNELVALNPELKQVAVNKNDGMELQSSLEGAASQINVDDINIFIMTPRKTGKMSVFADVPKIYGLVDIERKIELATGVEMRWAASPKTIQKIKAQLQAEKKL